MAVVELQPGLERVAAGSVPVDRVAAFMRSVFTAESGRAFLTAEDLANLWASPNVDPERDVALVCDRAGELAAAAIVLSRPPHTDPGCFAAVAPAHHGTGLGSALLGWEERRARERLGEAPDGARVALQVWVDASHDRSVRLMTDHGFEVDRYFITMEVAFDGSPERAVLPAGMELRPFTDDQLEAGLAANVDAFRDHYGYVDRRFEQRLEELRHNLRHPEFDPTLWWHLYEGDEIVANLWCYPAHEGDGEVGYVQSLGVRKPWRGRGIGRNLLLHAFGEFHRRGKGGAALDVDAHSLTGATRLYESVGMRETFRNAAYSKELRPGRDLSVRSL